MTDETANPEDRRPGTATPDTVAKPAGTAVPAPVEGDRIAKVMARAGVASRREAERMIIEGRVTVNGQKIDSPALDILPSDQVRIDGKAMEEPQETRLWLYYKPTGLVTSASDEKGRQTIFDALPRDLPRVMTVGRLDLNSEGLLLLTNDGELKRRLELPTTGWLRRYRVRVNGRPNDLTFDPLRRGVTIDGEDFAPMEIKLDSQQGANAWLTVGIREGRNREIRRAMAHVGLTVNRLIRVGYGPFRLTGLEENEVKEIKRRMLRDQLGGLLTGEAEEVKEREFRERGASGCTGRGSRGEDSRSERGERKPLSRRDGKPFARREDGDRKPWAKREGDRPSARGEDGDRKPWAKREGEGKPFARREDSDRKPWVKRDGDRPSARGEDGDRKPWAKREGEGKPFARREDSDRKPWVKRDGDRPSARGEDGDRKPWAKREGDGKPFARREDSDRKPWAKREGDRPSARGEDGDRKPWAKREGDGKPFARREDGDRKPWAKREGEGKPHARHEGAGKPWAKRDGEGKPGVRRSDSAPNGGAEKTRRAPGKGTRPEGKGPRKPRG